jgi:hypothetical protein
MKTKWSTGARAPFQSEKQKTARTRLFHNGHNGWKLEKMVEEPSGMENQPIRFNPNIPEILITPKQPTLGRFDPNLSLQCACLKQTGDKLASNVFAV